MPIRRKKRIPVSGILVHIYLEIFSLRGINNSYASGITYFFKNDFNNIFLLFLVKFVKFFFIQKTLKIFKKKSILIPFWDFVFDNLESFEDPFKNPFS